MVLKERKKKRKKKKFVYINISYNMYIDVFKKYSKINFLKFLRNLACVLIINFSIGKKKIKFIFGLSFIIKQY